MLKIDNVTMKFGGVIAANKFNANIKKGQIVGLIGPQWSRKDYYIQCSYRSV